MSDEPLGLVVVTAREIYNAIQQLTGRVDVLITQQADAIKDIHDHEERIRTLERARWPLPSVGLILALLSLVVTLVRV